MESQRRLISRNSVDGAAGEGLLDATDILAILADVMIKYLDVAKEIAVHVLPLPEGYRFSDFTFNEN